MLSKFVYTFLIFIMVLHTIFMPAESLTRENHEAVKNICEALKKESFTDLKNYLPNRERLFVNWSGAFSASGYFGTGQFEALIKDFFRENKVESCESLVVEAKDIEPGKIFFPVQLRYKKETEKKSIQRKIYLLLTRNRESISAANPQGWVIIEIKTIH